MSPAPVVLFDGVCNLCNAAVQWILKRDAEKVFRFASLQSDFARKLLRQERDLPDSVVLVDEAGVHTQSAAALRIARRLPFPWPLLAVITVIPRPLRDAAYGWIARNRYRWFGQRETCMVPTPEVASRFFDAGEVDE